MTDMPSRGDMDYTAGEPAGPFVAAILQLFDAIVEQAGVAAGTELTVASGAITPVTGIHSVDTESDDAADDLANIDLTNLPEGRWLFLKPENPARVVTVKHNAGGAGEIILRDGADVALDDAAQILWLERVGDAWHEVIFFGGPFSVADGSITTAMLASAAVTAAKLATDAVSTSKIAAAAVTVAKMADAAKPYDMPFVMGWEAGQAVDLEVREYFDFIPGHSFQVTGTVGAIGDVSEGAAVEIDIKKNGVSIYSTRPSFAATTGTFSAGALDGTVTFNGTTDVMTVEIPQIGSTTPGAQARVTLLGKLT